MAENMNLGEICNRNVFFAFKHLSVSEAARQMLEHHVGSLVIVEENDVGRIVIGMLTDRDIAIAVVARDFNAQTLRVGDVMSTSLVTARADDTLHWALSLMRRQGVRRLPITTSDGVLIGIVTMDDVLGLIGENLGSVMQTIENERKRELHVRG